MSRYPFHELTEPGQSFTHPCPTRADAERLRAYACIYGKRNGKTFTTRKDQQGNVRVELQAITQPLRTGNPHLTFTQRIRDLQVGQHLDRQTGPPTTGSVRVQVWTIGRQINRTFTCTTRPGWITVKRTA